MSIKEGYTRVTEILSQWDKYSFIPQEILERKKTIGTTVHQAIIDHNSGLPIVLTDDEGGKYFQSYLLWHRIEKFEIVKDSQRYYSDNLMITGEIDALVKYQGRNELILVDWKTSASTDALAWEMQAMFYMHLLRINGVENLAPYAFFVKLDKDANLPKLFRYDYSEAVMDDCYAAVKTYRRMKRWLDKRNFITNEEIF
jgi:hypothetical protein